jgi:phenylalanyl-tRNA synthetase beta chain
LLAAGEDADLFEVKGVLAAALGPVEFTPEAGLVLRVTGPGVTGSLRRLPRVLAEAHEAQDGVYYAEVVIDGWLETAPAAVRVAALPKFPAVQRDLSLVVPRSTPYAAIEKSLRGAKAPHLQTVGLKDVFADPSGSKLPADQRAVTVTLTFRDEGRTLTSNEVDRAVETLRDHAKAELGAVFRG